MRISDWSSDVCSSDLGKPRSVIPVDDVRRLLAFARMTAGEGGWRVAVVDAVDEMNRHPANALLKIREDPPPPCLPLLASPAPGRLPPTPRPRSRQTGSTFVRAQGVSVGAVLGVAQTS